MAIIRYPWLDDGNEGVVGFVNIKTSGQNIPREEYVPPSDIVRWQLEVAGAVISSTNGDELNIQSQHFGKRLLATNVGLFLAGAGNGSGSEWRATAYGTGTPPYVSYTQVVKQGVYIGSAAYVRYRASRSNTGHPNDREQLFQRISKMPTQVQFGDWLQIGHSPQLVDNAPDVPDDVPDDVDNSNPQHTTIAKIKTLTRQLASLVERI